MDRSESSRNVKSGDFRMFFQGLPWSRGPVGACNSSNTRARELIIAADGLASRAPRVAAVVACGGCVEHGVTAFGTCSMGLFIFLGLYIAECFGMF